MAWKKNDKDDPVVQGFGPLTLGLAAASMAEVFGYGVRNARWKRGRSHTLENSFAV
jgi:hypothetical protein